jgi:hypothetical protein
VLTVLNLKGGIDKTHTVWLLTGVCEERARKHGDANELLGWRVLSGFRPKTPVAG